MQKIDFDDGTARMEPGMTIRTPLSCFVEPRTCLHIPDFGGSIDASMLASAPEREARLGEQSDRFRGFSGSEVLLSNGAPPHLVDDSRHNPPAAELLHVERSVPEMSYAHPLVMQLLTMS